jgi:hypothetical protein
MSYEFDNFVVFIFCAATITPVGSVHYSPVGEYNKDEVMNHSFLKCTQNLTRSHNYFVHIVGAVAGNYLSGWKDSWPSHQVSCGFNVFNSSESFMSLIQR